MICYSPKYDGYRDLWKVRRVEEYTIAAYYSRPFSQILKENEELDMMIEYKKLGGELEDRIFLTYVSPEKSSTDIQVVATISQRLFEAF